MAAAATWLSLILMEACFAVVVAPGSCGSSTTLAVQGGAHDPHSQPGSPAQRRPDPMSSGTSAMMPTTIMNRFITDLLFLRAGADGRALQQVMAA